SIADLTGIRDHREALARTRSALLEGTEIVVQAALEQGRWFGRPDVLIRIDRPSRNLGAWSYEAADAKLARETRGGTILQLGLYCEMLEAFQGLAPDRFHVVTPGEDAVEGTEARPIVRTYRVADYAAYFRLLKARLEGAVAGGHRELEAATYPEPVDHCDICPWIHGCADRRRADDHLSLVAGISRVQRRELQSRQIATMADLAAMAHPLPFKPRRGAVATYERVRDQARLQVRSRQEGRIVFEIIPPPEVPLLSTGKPAEPVGLARLPEPSPGDVFLDLEGDPLAGSLVADQGQLGAMNAGAGGREYLFGLVTVDLTGQMVYQPWWADSPSAERLAFEAVVDLIMARWSVDPAMHVYHYAPYEPSAFKRLMGRYATREREIDRLLRGRRFVDLYAVVRRGVRAGVERYSIKNMEPLYAFTREVALADANRALRVMEQALEMDQLDLATPEVRSVIAGYNRDDCVSTLRLRNWLEARRTELIARGTSISRPPLEPGEESEELDERAKRVEGLRARLLDGVPDEPGVRSPDDHARYLLAYLLD
ncbi:MAG TPA: TM0106 family RecB-like putative nuclease, partial [Vicinamibacterales bacterium]